VEAKDDLHFTLLGQRRIRRLVLFSRLRVFISSLSSFRTGISPVVSRLANRRPQSHSLRQSSDRGDCIDRAVERYTRPPTPKILTGETPDTSPCHPNHISKRFLRLETTILDARGPSTWYPLHGISTYHSALSMRLLCLYHWCSRYLSPFTVYSPSGGA
jgi:hypothetical protein